MLTDLNTLLEIAEKRGCAIPAFNVYNQETVMGALDAAAETDSVVILQIYSRLFDSVEAEFLAPSILAAAHRSKVKVALHLDHGSSDNAVAKALRLGCTGVMRDASSLPYEQNVAVVKNVAELAHTVGVPIEGELGHIGVAKDGVSTEYTKADEAADYVKQTGVDALAILVGTAHGHYKQAPVLALDRIAEIHAATKAHLVLHGGSGVPDDHIKAATQRGIGKINFSTDLCCSYLDAIRKVSPDIIAVDMFMKEPIQAAKRFCLSKIELLGSEHSNA